MAVTRAGYSITMTALNDAVTGRLCIDSLAFVGTGLTAADRITITDTNGSVIGDHYAVGTNENVEFMESERKWVNGLKITNAPGGGTWRVIARLR